jgi:ribosomal-protein-alanine N-acetyltransferase
VPASHQTADYHIIPLTADHARQILRWRYQPPYDFYNSPDTGVIEQQYIGLGMRPSLSGQGRGVAFFTSTLAFRQPHFYATRLRLTVAQFNRRALALYKQFGFQKTAEFTDPRHAIAYTVLNLDVTTPC